MSFTELACAPCRSAQAGAVYNLRHGFGADATHAPKALEGELADLADEITATVARTLHVAKAKDEAVFQPKHAAIEAAAKHKWALSPSNPLSCPLMPSDDLNLP